jgi:hypothetical protein
MTEWGESLAGVSDALRIGCVDIMSLIGDGMKSGSTHSIAAIPVPTLGQFLDLGVQGFANLGCSLTAVILEPQ